MILGELNWLDFKALDKGKLVAVYAIASFEQHGHHLPFLTDTMETDEIVRRLDSRLPDDVVCLPTQWLGYSHHHRRYPGSLTATSDTHINLVVETIGCLIESGLPNVLVINGHGGNKANLRVALQKLKEPGCPRLWGLLVGCSRRADGSPQGGGSQGIRTWRRDRDLDDDGHPPRAGENRSLAAGWPPSGIGIWQQSNAISATR